MWQCAQAFHCSPASGFIAALHADCQPVMASQRWDLVHGIFCWACHGHIQTLAAKFLSGVDNNPEVGRHVCVLQVDQARTNKAKARSLGSRAEALADFMHVSKATASWHSILQHQSVLQNNSANTQLGKWLGVPACILWHQTVYVDYSYSCSVWHGKAVLPTREPSAHGVPSMQQWARCPDNHGEIAHGGLTPDGVIRGPLQHSFRLGTRPAELLLTAFSFWY
jgi:hypothetical protein